MRNDHTFYSSLPLSADNQTNIYTEFHTDLLLNVHFSANKF